MIVGERQKREEEKKRLQEEIRPAKNDISKLEEDRKSAKVENDERIEKELEKEKVINQRIAELDAAVKAYRDQGPGGFLKEDGFRKAAELLKSQKEEREALRASPFGDQCCDTKGQRRSESKIYFTGRKN